jgi:MFS superfamily sulfate permease-like transporter
MMKSESFSQTLGRDLVAGLVVFLVALPLCLGVALASNAPLFSGIVAGVVGGIVVGILSGSQSSVSGPAAGLTAVVALQIQNLGSFEAFLTVVMLAGIIQLVLGFARMGTIADFVPSSVIKGLLAAIGIILIYRQMPYVLGYPSGTTWQAIFNPSPSPLPFHFGAALIGIASIVLLEVWEHTKRLKQLPIPAPLVVVLLGNRSGCAVRNAGWLLAAER